MARTKQLYDIEEYAAKVRNALNTLRHSEKPDAAKRGSKEDVLAAVGKDLQALAAEGYSVQQIADAIQKGDIFSILPKSIADIVSAPKPPRPKKSRSAVRAKSPTQPSVAGSGPQQSRASVAMKPGSLPVRADTPDTEL